MGMGGIGCRLLDGLGWVDMHGQAFILFIFGICFYNMHAPMAPAPPLSRLQLLLVGLVSCVA
jgi:hypothetical protein